jgi:hypothetical protein
MKHKTPQEPAPRNSLPVISSPLSMKFMAASFYLTEARLAKTGQQAARNAHNNSGAPRDA